MQMDTPKTSSARQNIGTVLVVDDNDDGRMLAIHALERSGFTCFAALSGGEAIEIAMERADTIDAIVLDVNMPRMDGFEVLRTLMRFPATASIPVIFLTGGATSDVDIVRGVDSG
ncbi:MAG: response regulator, partial [Polyangiaceae bacterium]